MAEGLADALAEVRQRVGDTEGLVRAVAAGRRRGAQPRWRRVELRHVDLKAGRHLQVTRYDTTQAHTTNHRGADAAAVLDELLEEPYGNWHVWTTAPEGTEELHVRVTKRGAAQRHVRRSSDGGGPVDRAHDRERDRILPEDDPLLRALGIADAEGRVKPSRQRKYRQVEAFLRILAAAVEDATRAGALRTPTQDAPLRVVDLGCGNAYLTFAAHRFLAGVQGLPVRVVGVDSKAQSLEHNTALARALGVADAVEFRQAAIDDVDLPAGPDVVLALHACDTATDDALARAVRWQAALVLAAPCCHHDLAAQLGRSSAPSAYSSLVRDGILRERFADTLTDAVRAASLRLRGYRVDVVEFVESRHTPRNTLLRAVRTGHDPDDTARAELDALVTAWGIRPRLQELLA